MLCPNLQPHLATSPPPQADRLWPPSHILLISFRLRNWRNHCFFDYRFGTNKVKKPFVLSQVSPAYARQGVSMKQVSPKPPILSISPCQGRAGATPPLTRGGREGFELDDCCWSYSTFYNLLIHRAIKSCFLRACRNMNDIMPLRQAQVERSVISNRAG